MPLNGFTPAAEKQVANDASKTITTVAGDPAYWAVSAYNTIVGDGGAATLARLNKPQALAVALDGDLIIAGVVQKGVSACPCPCSTLDFDVIMHCM